MCSPQYKRICRSKSPFTTTANWASWSSSRRARGLLPVYTNLTNPDFGKVAEAMGLWGRTVRKAEELESAVAEWLGQPGPALLNVKVEPMELVMPPFTAPEAVYGMAMYSIKAVMHGKAGDVFEMIGENFI